MSFRKAVLFRASFWALLSSALVPFAAQGQSTLGQSTDTSQYSPNSTAVDCSDPVNAQTGACQGNYDSNGTQDLGGYNPDADPYRLGASQANSGNRMQPYGSDRSLNSNADVNDERGTNTANRQSGYPVQREAPEPLTEFQKFISSTDAVVLPIFGANLFTTPATTFAPNDQPLVSPDYLLGPGDELRVHIWGQVNFNSTVRVDRSGDIYLPQVGAVHVASLPYGAVESHIRSAVEHVFRNFQLTVDLGRLRGLQVFVVGQVKRPGAYTVSSQSTLLNALLLSGGPSIQGSLRSIELKRGGATVTVFDLYDVLLNGDKTKDMTLMEGDVIFVPPVGPQVAILGSVHRPAIYELRPGSELRPGGMLGAGVAGAAGTTAGDLLKFAGGLTPVASQTHLSLERLDGKAGRLTVDVAFSSGALDAPLRDGDIVRAPSITPSYQQTVTLRGNTANPGRFTWHAGMHVSELIPDRSSLLTRNYWWNRTLMGLPAPQFEPDPTAGVTTQPRYPVDWSDCPQARSPDQPQQTNAPLPSNCRPQNRYAYYPQSNSTTNGQSADRSIAGSGLANAPNTALANPVQDRANSMQSSPNEAIDEGAPMGGQSGQRTDVRLPAPEIDWNYAVVERLDPQTLRTSLLPFNLGHLVMDHDTSQDLELQAGDVVTVFSQADIRVPVRDQTKLVRLEGEVASAGVYSALPGETLQQLVRRAGGLTPNAYLFGSTFTRESARRFQQQRLNEYTRGLELNLERASVQANISGLQSAASTQAVASEGRGLISLLNQMRASGRVVFQIPPDASGLDAIPDLPLEDGDRFHIPARPAVVNVLGTVYNQSAFLFEPRRSVGDYLRTAGISNPQADTKREFIVRANGSVVSRRDEGPHKFESFHLEPGDTIVVPERSLRPSSLRAFTAYSQIFSQLAFGSASLAVLQ